MFTAGPKYPPRCSSASPVWMPMQNVQIESTGTCLGSCRALEIVSPRHGRAGPMKGYAEAVTGPVEDVATVARDEVLDHVAMTSQHPAHRLSVLSPHLRGVVDLCEGEGHDAGGQTRRAG